MMTETKATSMAKHGKLVKNTPNTVPSARVCSQ